MANAPVYSKGEARGWAAARRGEENGERPRVTSLGNFDPEPSPLSDLEHDQAPPRRCASLLSFNRIEVWHP
jgi:hypothetical protein